MGDSKIAKGLEKLVTNSSKLVGTLQTGVNKILWGSANTQPAQTVKYTPATQAGQTGSLAYSSSIPANPTPPKANLVNSGLFNALDALNSVNLCDVITYAYDSTNIKKKPRKNRASASLAEKALYDVQDQAALAVKYIDKYTAFPNTFISSYIGPEPEVTTFNQAVSESNAPAQGGTAVQKYNAYFLMQALKETFTFGSTSNSTSSIFTPEEKDLLAQVPGLASNVGILKDFVGTVSKYTDYTQISNVELQKIQNKITTVRTVCVTIQNLDVKGAINLVGNFLGVDIRSQIQKLSKYVDITKIIPTLKQINSALRSFIRIANQVQGILTLGQFVIRLALLFYKIFKFIIAFFSALPLPLIFSAAGPQTALQDAKDKIKDETDGVMRILKAINALLAVILVFIRYLLTNTNELLKRLDTLLVSLQGCEAVKDSDVVAQLQQTQADLVALRDQLATFVINYDSKIDPDTALFGEYQIRVVDEEVTDKSVKNLRRRGVALNKNGQVAAQSDLTFATNSSVIIAETKQKLVALGLVQPYLASLDTVNLAIISDSLNYLDNNDVIDDNFNVTTGEISNFLDSPDNSDENKGIGLQAFVNNLKGGRRLRRRARTKMAENQRQFATQLKNSDPSGKYTGNLASQQLTQANQAEIQNLKDQIDEWKGDIAKAALLPANPASIALIADRTKKIKTAKDKIAQLQKNG